MSLESVKQFFSDYQMDHRIMVLETSTATVEEAAKLHGVDPDQIGRRGPECIHTIDNSGAEAVLKL